MIRLGGKSREDVQRVAAVIEQIERQTTAKTQQQLSNNPYRKLFDAIASAAGEASATPIPMQLLRDCFMVEAKTAQGSKPEEAGFLLKSIQNVVRQQQSAHIVTYEFDVDGLTLFQEVTALGAGQKSVGEEILDGMLNDPKGPQIDVRKILREAFAKRVKLTCDYREDGSLAYLVEISLNDQAKFLPSFQRFFESDPRYLANATKDFYVLSQPASGEASKFSRWAATVLEQKLYCGSLEMVEARRDRTHMYHRDLSTRDDQPTKN